MPLQHTYRPRKWDEVVGNEVAISSLRTVLTREKDMPQAFLLTGPSGCGKTTVARLIAGVLGCADMDIQELNAADFRGIDTARELRRRAGLRPLSLKSEYRFWLLDECHQLTGDAQEALLKLLEEPPAHAVIALATTEPQKLKVTLKRRCHEVRLAAIPQDILLKYLGEVTDEEGVKIPGTVLTDIAKYAAGSVGVALRVLDGIIDLPPGEMKEAAAIAAASEKQAIDLCRALLDGEKGWNKAREIISGLRDVQEAESVRRMIMEYASKALIGSDHARAGLVLCVLRDNPTYDAGWPGLIASCYEASLAS